MNIYTDWKLDELADVLYLFKTIQLDPNYRNNYKELARRMTDAGWQRDNDQCRHQIERMKKRYDALVDGSSKTGSSNFLEPLTKELNECFGALKDVNPDQVYSSRRGSKFGNPVNPEDNTESTDGPSTSSAETKEKKPKSNYEYFIN